MHHVRVALDGELLRHLDRADLGDAADIVAAEVEQHQMLGQLLGVGQQLLGERLVLDIVGAALARTGQRPDGHLAVAQTDQDFRARTHQGKLAEIEEEQERARVGPA